MGSERVSMERAGLSGGSLVSALTPYSDDVTLQRFNASTRQRGEPIQTSLGIVEGEDQTHPLHFPPVSRMALVVSVSLASFQLLAQNPGKERPMKHPTFYRTTKIDGLSIFYREAGPKNAPTLLLLHGLPSSSRMFEPLFARLSDHYHLVAPDYPGFGHSD